MRRATCDVLLATLLFRSLFHLFHHAQQVAAPDFADLFLAVTTADELEDKVRRSVVNLAGQTGDGRMRFGAILGSSLRKAADRKRLLELHLANEGSTEDFWSAVRADPALGAKSAQVATTSADTTSSSGASTDTGSGVQDSAPMTTSAS